MMKKLIKRRAHTRKTKNGLVNVQEHYVVMPVGKSGKRVRTRVILGEPTYSTQDPITGQFIGSVPKSDIKGKVTKTTKSKK